YMTQFQYDPVGNRTGGADANTHKTGFFFDADNRLTQQVDPIGNATNYQYDEVGDLVLKTDSLGTRTMKYDADRRRVEEDLPDSRKIVMAYDAGGRLTQETDWIGTYQFNYDPLN